MLSMISKRRFSILAVAVLATGPLAIPVQAELGAWPSIIPLPAELVAAAARTGSDEGNLVTNGSFECRTTGQPPSHIETLAPGRTDLVGWEIIDASPLPAPGESGKLDAADRAPGWTIDWIGPTRWKAADGKHCLDLDGGIRQKIKTEPGKTYELRFDFAANPELGPSTAQLRVLIDDDRHEFSCESAGHDTGNLGWSTRSITFQAARQETTLTFDNSQPNSQSIGVALDHVVVATGKQPKDRYRVTDTSQGPILLDTATGQSWRLAMQDGQSVWLPIPRQEENDLPK